MRLLIITQKIDLNDDILGFFHRWMEKFSQKFGLINIICLQKGEALLPSNVTIRSLGKEMRKSRIQYLYRFYKFIWTLRTNYDVVLIHMNPIYIFLGGIFWKVWKKKIFLWYNHKYGGFLADLGIKSAQTAFYTSPFSFTAAYKNSKKMPAGIDTELFKKIDSIEKQKNAILYVGRISPVKKVDVLINTANILHEKGIDFVLYVVGAPEEQDNDYFKTIKTISKKLEQNGRIKFLGKIPNYKVTEIYNECQLAVNLSPSGLFDKTVVEAMACETIVLVSNKSFKRDLPEECMFEEGDAKELAEKIIFVLNLPEKDKMLYGKNFRNYVVENHSLDRLINDLLTELQLSMQNQ